MHGGRVLLVEPNPFRGDIFDNGIRLFGRGEHRVTERAADLAGALAVLDRVADGVVDANLVVFPVGLPTEPAETGETADASEIIAQRIEELGLAMRMVGTDESRLSAEWQPAAAAAVDVTLQYPTAPRLVRAFDALADVDALRDVAA
jgi:hypothetical protein